MCRTIYIIECQPEIPRFVNKNTFCFCCNSPVPTTKIVRGHFLILANCMYRFAGQIKIVTMPSELCFEGHRERACKYISADRCPSICIPFLPLLLFQQVSIWAFELHLVIRDREVDAESELYVGLECPAQILAFLPILVIFFLKVRFPCMPWSTLWETFECWR